MGFNRSPLAFDDVKEVLERALDSPKGIRVTFETTRAAVDFRRRANTYRKQERERSVKLYAPGDPLYGVSIYDKYILRLVDSVIYIELRTTDGIKVEEIE